MNQDREGLARHLRVAPPSEARLARWWGAIDAAPRPRAWPRWAAPAAAGVLLAAVLVLLVVQISRRPISGTVEGAVLESGEQHAVTLADGSRIALAPGARVRLATYRDDAVEAVLERGAVDLDVVHVDGRRFVVRAGAYDVLVVGTRFRVALGDDSRVTVSVERGRVEVRARDGHDVRPVASGESWTSAPEIDQAPPATPSAAPEPPAPSSSEAPKPPPSAAIVPPPSFSAEVASAGPKQLLELAQDARIHGRPRDAAAAFDALRRRFRGDPRAGLAAFELGRLRMDSFGDPAGALEAFDDAIALAPGGSFREDAEARRVSALDAMHDGRCAQARDAYLARWPRGSHAASVARRCGAR